MYDQQFTVVKANSLHKQKQENNTNKEIFKSAIILHHTPNLILFCIWSDRSLSLSLFFFRIPN